MLSIYFSFCVARFQFAGAFIGIRNEPSNRLILSHLLANFHQSFDMVLTFALKKKE